MNYKYLSKYHYIYRLSFHDNYTAHIEKLPIAYANKTYMYIIEPGNPELRKLTLTPTVAYCHGNIYTEVNDKIKGEIADRLNSRYRCSQLNSRYRCSQLLCWFLVDDLEPLKELIDEFQHKNLQKLYLERERERLDLSVRNMKYDLEKKAEELERINQKIAESR